MGDGVSFGLTRLVRGGLDYDGGVDANSSTYVWNKFSGQLLTSSIVVGGIVLKPFTGESQLVTQSTVAGEIGVNTHWVMVGGNTYRNYLFAGDPQLQASFSQYVPGVVPGLSLRWPPGCEWIKGFLGERILN